MIHSEGALTLTCTKIRLLFGTINYLKPQVGTQLTKGCRPRLLQ